MRSKCVGVTYDFSGEFTMIYDYIGDGCGTGATAVVYGSGWTAETSAGSNSSV